MPTQAEMPRQSPHSYQETHWTDDLPVCRNTGVGSATNQVYRADGQKQEEHPFEDTSFHCSVDESTFLYGVFDGHDGVQCATFALQRLAAELLLGQLSGKTTDEEVKEVLRQAFVAVEKSYLESVDGKVAERTSLQYEIPEGFTPYEAYQKFPDVVSKLDALNCELSCGTTAVVGLITGGKLYVANVGDSRALLCRTDSSGVLRVVQLSQDHDLSNEDELLRLFTLGLRIDSSCRLGNQDNTRCIGNYLVKGGYKEFEELSSAMEEPIIAEPEIHGGIHLDESCRFLLLMSDGLYKSLEEATGTDQVNKDIAKMAVAEFREQSTLMGVAQAVVDKIVRLHHDRYMGGGARDDITLLVRNFNYPMPNQASVRFAPHPTTIPSLSHDEETSRSGRTEGTTTTDSSGPPLASHIPPYVDFSDFYRNIETARQNGTLPPELEF